MAEVDTFSDEFKKKFLIKFTRELIRHSVTADILQLEKIIEKKEKRKNISKEKYVQIENLELPKKISPPEKTEIKKRQFTKPVSKVSPSTLLIPEPKLPAHLEYLKPVATANVSIDLFKLNPFVKDPGVRIIEANPDEKVVVTGTMGTKPTDVFMSKEDINRVINAFSVEAKIPISEGVYKVAVGNLILSAIISDVVGSKFIIKKMITPASVSQNAPPQIRKNNFR